MDAGDVRRVLAHGCGCPLIGHLSTAQLGGRDAKLALDLRGEVQRWKLQPPLKVACVALADPQHGRDLLKRLASGLAVFGDTIHAPRFAYA